MTLDDLRVFLVVSRHGSFSAAARRLKCSQPAVSQHVQRLEGELEIALFHRRPKGVALTDAGELLHKAAAEALATLDRAIERVGSVRRAEVGSLVVATGGTTVKHFMMGAVARFRKAYPRVRIQFQAALSSADCIELLVRGPVDLAFITMGPAIDGIAQQPVLEMDYVLLTSADQPLAQRARVTVDELDGVDCIGLAERATSRNQLERSLGRRGVTLETSMTVFDWDTAKTLVELGLGSAIVPSWHAHESVARASVRAVPITGLPPVRVGWALRKDEEPMPPARAFMELLGEELAKEDVPGVRVLV